METHLDHYEHLLFALDPMQNQTEEFQPTQSRMKRAVGTDSTECQVQIGSTKSQYCVLSVYFADVDVQGAGRKEEGGRRKEESEIGALGCGSDLGFFFSRGNG